MNEYEITLRDRDRLMFEVRVKATGVLQAMRKCVADAIYRGHRNPKVIMIREAK